MDILFFYIVLAIEHKVSYMLSKGSPTEPDPTLVICLKEVLCPCGEGH